jgi:hypothetical protein
MFFLLENYEGRRENFREGEILVRVLGFIEKFIREWVSAVEIWENF